MAAADQVLPRSALVASISLQLVAMILGVLFIGTAGVIFGPLCELLIAPRALSRNGVVYQSLGAPIWSLALGCLVPFALVLVLAAPAPAEDESGRQAAEAWILLMSIGGPAVALGLLGLRRTYGRLAMIGLALGLVALAAGVIAWRTA